MFGLLTFEVGGGLRVGLWGDYQDPYGLASEGPCDFGCRYYGRWIAGGLTATLQIGGPAAAVAAPLPRD